MRKYRDAVLTVAPQEGRIGALMERTHVDHVVMTVSQMGPQLVGVLGAFARRPFTADDATELAAVAEAALDTVGPAAEAKALRLEASFDPAAGTVAGDAARLHQVAWNLLSNAVKFTPKGGRVSVRLGRDGTSVELAVEDTRQGIAPDFLPHVFDPFRQADEGPTRASGGLGLGLAIVRQLVELHGGTVHARSGGPGLGATFVVRLPLGAPP